MSLESGQRKWRLITNTISSNVSKRCKYVTFFLFSISFQNWNPSCYVHSSFKFSNRNYWVGFNDASLYNLSLCRFPFHGYFKVIFNNFLFCSVLFPFFSCYSTLFLFIVCFCKQSTLSQTNAQKLC